MFKHFLSRSSFNKQEGVVFLDGISLLDATIIYSLLFSPLLTMVLLFFWTSANMANNAKVQLLGIFILLVLGFLAINSPFILIIESAAIILFILWLITYRASFLNGQISLISTIFILQFVFYLLFFIFFSARIRYC